jgi:mannose-6-phosphate isomerase-like protein (cupin superfamily)
MKVERWNLEKDGVLSKATLRRKLESMGYSTSCYIYPPGTNFPAHTHGVEKMDAVLSGQFRITMREGSVVLGPGDAILVPRGTEHSAEVIGNENVVSVDAIKR